MNATAPHEVEQGQTVAALAAFDEPAIALAITTITGHASGTFEHERCLQRVVASFEAGHPAWVRSESDGTHTHADLLRPAQFNTIGGA